MQFQATGSFVDTKTVIVAITLAAMVQPGLAREAKVEDLQATAPIPAKQTASPPNRIDTINETDKLTAEYRELQRKLDRLGSRKLQLQKQLQNQAEEKASLERQLQRVPSDAQFSTLARQMVESLDHFIRADLPFHRKARLQQAADLRILLTQADTQPSEKMRRIIKAYRDELDYGRTIEAYDGELTNAETAETSSRQRLVTFLRYGRVTLVYQTFDGKEAAYWDRSEQRWRPLNGRFTSDIRQGIRIALKRVPPDMMIVPVRRAMK